MGEALFIQTPDGSIEWTDAGRADVGKAVAKYLTLCGVPRDEWSAIIEGCKGRGGSKLDLEREVQQWLSDHGRALCSTTSPCISDETLARVAKRFRRKAILDERVNAHLDRVDQRDAQERADSSSASDGPWSKPDSPSRWAKRFGISARTFTRRVADGKIRAKKLSDRLYLVHVDDVPR